MPFFEHGCINNTLAPPFNYFGYITRSKISEICEVISSTPNGLKFAIPLRSEISHPTDVLWTDKSAKHGLDFTKAVLVNDKSYIGDLATIDNKEYIELNNKYYFSTRLF